MNLQDSLAHLVIRLPDDWSDAASAFVVMLGPDGTNLGWTLCGQAQEVPAVVTALCDTAVAENGEGGRH